jgi:hypothetical protein
LAEAPLIDAENLFRQPGPPQFEVLRVSTRISNTVPSQTTFAVTTFTVPPHGYAWFDDHVINIGQPPVSSTLECFAEFEIRYGRPGSLKYHINVRKQVVLAFGDAPDFVEVGEAGIAVDDARRH